ncbi:MAG TPA: hypothetical protein VE868_08250 [Balneolaceae bacterium]|nr:hypothetical protein [Balneolaceae bacterium]
MSAIIGLCIAGGLLAIGILAIIVAGIRGMFNGEQNYKKIGMIFVPIIVYIISYFISNALVKAAIITMFVMLALMALAILLTGARSTFNL